MPLGSGTADIHMINIAVNAADGSGGVWQDAKQMIPTTMYGNPEGFVASLKAGLPLVNNLRILFNEYSFNADGSMNPQFERFLAAAAAAGYKITLTYGNDETQNLGIGDAEHPHLTNAQAYAALQKNFATVSGAWDSMMDWMDGHKSTKAAVYGWDLINEAAGYRHTVAANGADANYAPSDFVKLLAQHYAALAQDIEARAAGKILVGGWGYNGDFTTLANAAMGGGSVLDFLRDAVGADRLVWSGHLYPGWMGTNTTLDPTSLAARLTALYGALGGDDLLITETNINGEVDDQAQPVDANDVFAASMEWFAANGVGIGWYPGAQTGASHLLYVEKNGALTIRHQHSFAAAMNVFSLEESQSAHAGNEAVAVTLTDGRLRNESYEIARGEAQYDLLTKFGTAFGFGGNDTLQGSVLANDFMYGGVGNDLMKAEGGDDFMFGQGDDDRMIGGNGNDHLFGGDGRDTLDGGAGTDVLAGGAGDDTYLLRNVKESVREYANGGTDLITTALGSLSLTGTQFVFVENLNYTGSGNFRGTGNALNNVMAGGAGNDTLSGGDGRDTLSGYAGDDSLTGGTGADRFIFGAVMGHDVLSDFDDQIDQIMFRGVAGVTTVADAMSHATQIGADVVFDFGVSDVVTVRDITLAAISNDILIG